MTGRCDHVWDRSLEPWRPRTFMRCVKCGAIRRDFEHYVVMLTLDMPVESVLDVGTGNKGPVAEHYWVHYKRIKRGYVCDIWTIKENLNPIWVKLKMNALDLLDVLGPRSVDVVQAFGFLEHLEKEDGYRFLEIAEELARKLVIVSGAITLHGPTPDYKVKIDGNPYHLYRSLWRHEEFHRIGWQTDWEYYARGESYMGDVIAWKFVDPTWRRKSGLGQATRVGHL